MSSEGEATPSASFIMRWFIYTTVHDSLAPFVIYSEIYRNDRQATKVRGSRWCFARHCGSIHEQAALVNAQDSRSFTTIWKRIWFEP